MKILWKFITMLLWTSFAWGQVVPQAGSMKLLAYDQKDQAVTDILVTNNEIYASVPSVDSTPGNFYPVRGSYILKMDSLATLVTGTLHIQVDSISNLYIEKLFPIRNPTLGTEMLVGFFARGISLIDSSSFAVCGFFNSSFTNFEVSRKFFLMPAFSGAFMPPILHDLYFINDSLFLTYLHVPTSLTTTDKILALFSFTNQGFNLLDSITVSSGNIAKIFGSPSLNKIVLSVTTPSNLQVFYLVNYTPSLSLIPLATPSPLNISGDIQTTEYCLRNDTLYSFYIARNVTTNSYIIQKHVFFQNNTGYAFIDSLTLASSDTLGTAYYSGNYMDFTNYPYAFVVFPGFHWEYYQNMFNHEYGWMHPYGQFSYFSVKLYDINSFNSYGSITLGGEALYGIKGIESCRDSACIVYGWRFPLGDLTRTDGDAFIWKITWDGLVTPILGKSPKYAFKIFPNPTKDILKISGKTEEATTFLLRSSDGKEVLTQKFPAGQENWELDVSQVPKGIYLLEILTGGARFTEKVVLE